ncbi:uncharacterized protein LOC113306204 [Papaver somniferum]|uniref:uncharacterized protein LOC113306204 n=1 Tax=Papaver somniferum TaxID=3469 RepID=UPI000E704621|nr:uncharacterized protein LOC113306204 [Papaver somniferum]
MASDVPENVNEILSHMHNASIATSEDIRNIVFLSTVDLSRGNKGWKWAVAGKVFREELMSIGVVVYHVRHVWSKYQELEVRTPAPLIFQVRFNSKDDLKEILKHVPWSLGGYMFRIHRWTPSIDYRTLNFGFQCFWIDFKDLVPEFFDVDVIYAMDGLVGQVQKIIPDDANPTDSNVVSVCVNIDLKKPLIRGILAVTASGYVQWVLFFYHQQTHNICPSCYIIDHVEAEYEEKAAELNTRARTIYKFGSHGVEIANNDPDEDDPDLGDASIIQSNPCNRRHRTNKKVFVKPDDDQLVRNFSVSNSITRTERSALRKYKRTRQQALLSQSASNSTFTQPMQEDDNQDANATSTSAHQFMMQQHQPLQPVVGECDGFLPSAHDTTRKTLTNWDDQTKSSDSKVQSLLYSLNYPHLCSYNIRGGAGGIALLWKDGFHLELMHHTSTMVNVIVHSGPTDSEWVLTCLYSSTYMAERQQQWQLIREMGDHMDLPWVIIGDFNSTLCISDRQSYAIHTAPSHPVITYTVDLLGLTDIPFTGNPYTWSNRKYSATFIRTRLYRALGDILWHHLFHNAVIHNLLPIGSDHAPILLSTDPTLSSMSIPFRVYESWFQHHTCKPLVQSQWKSTINGSAASNFTHKLSHTSTAPKKWRRENAREHILPFQDKNVKYFHARANFHRRRNQIDTIQDSQGIWHSTRPTIEQILINHFANISTTINPHMDSSVLSLISPCITSQDNDMLTTILKADKIRNIVFQIKSWAAPGPDGFYKHCWDVVGTDVVSMVQEFFTTCILLPQLNHTYQTLITKHDCAQTPSDFCSINLCNITYKIISKLMAVRLKTLLAKIVSPWQEAYVPGRNIMDNTIISHEMVDYMKKTKVLPGVIAIKLDMDKTTSTVSLMLNGSPTTSFTPTRGLFQGDPISPYLFILCMEGFSRIISHVVSSNIILPFKPAIHAPHISHLYFADDCILFTRDSGSSITNLLQIINRFCATSGQLVNFNKSSVHFSSKLSDSAKADICHMLQMKPMPLHEKYLGVSLFISKNKTKCFESAITKMQSRLPVWQGKLINQAGRSTQIQSVLNTMRQYQMACLHMPDSTLKQMDSIQRWYWWCHKRTRVMCFKSWFYVCYPKRDGGLGFKNLRATNEAFLTKLAWRMVNNPDAEWIKVLEAKYFHNINPLHGVRTTKGPWVWQSIHRGLKWVKQFHVWEIGDGTKVREFQDNWIPNTVTTTSTTAHSSSSADVKQCFYPSQVQAIISIHLSYTSNDTLRWSLTNSGDFTLKYTYRAILHSLFPPPVTIYNEAFWLGLWHLKFPYKCHRFMWKLAHQILPVLHRLARHMHIQNTSCHFCNAQEETVTHLFLNCPFSAAIWSRMLLHWSAMITSQSSITSWLQGWTDSANSFTFKDHHTVNMVVHVASLRNQNSDCCQMSDSSANDANSFQLNVDASVLPNNHVAGSAFILTDSTGSFVTATRNVIHAKILALYKTLCWLCSHQPSNVVIYSDCKNLVDGLGGSVNNVSWIDRSLLFECVSLLHSLSNMTIRYIHRVHNKAAGQLAKFARCQFCNIQWWYTLPVVLQSTITGSM